MACFIVQELWRIAFGRVVGSVALCRTHSIGTRLISFCKLREIFIAYRYMCLVIKRDCAMPLLYIIPFWVTVDSCLHGEAKSSCLKSCPAVNCDRVWYNQDISTRLCVNVFAGIDNRKSLIKWRGHKHNPQDEKFLKRLLNTRCWWNFMAAIQIYKTLIEGRSVPCQLCCRERSVWKRLAAKAAVAKWLKTKSRTSSKKWVGCSGSHIDWWADLSSFRFNLRQSFLPPLHGTI